MGDSRDKASRDPRKVKQLSYERDGVNRYGESSKASRKAIPKFKAATHRNERHEEVAALHQIAAHDLRADEDIEALEAKIASARFRGRHPAKRKTPDAPLGLVVMDKQKRSGKLKTKDHGPVANRRGSVAKALAPVSAREGKRPAGKKALARKKP